MTISEKILLFIEKKNIEQKDFAIKSDISVANFNHKLSGRVKFNADDFQKIKRAYPEIDFNYLFTDFPQGSYVKETKIKYSPKENLNIENDMKMILDIAKKYFPTEN